MVSILLLLLLEEALDCICYSLLQLLDFYYSCFVCLFLLFNSL